MAGPIRIPLDELAAASVVRRIDRAWLSAEPRDIALLYACDCEFREQGERLRGRQAVCSYVERQRRDKSQYRHAFRLWLHDDRRVAASVTCEWFDDATGFWFRGQGNARWEFDQTGRIMLHDLAIDAFPIPASERVLGADERPSADEVSAAGALDPQRAHA